MANWNTLKTAVADVINANGNQAITGQLLQNVLNNIITNVGENATFAGIANLDTNPGAPDGPVFYLATTAGAYPNFNGIEVQDGEAVILLWNNSAWSKKVTGFATQEKMQKLEENTNEKLSQLGSEVNKNPFCVTGEIIEMYVDDLSIVIDDLHITKKGYDGVWHLNFFGGGSSSVMTNTYNSEELATGIIPLLNTNNNYRQCGYVIVDWEKIRDGVNTPFTVINKSVYDLSFSPRIYNKIQQEELLNIASRVTYNADIINGIIKNINVLKKEYVDGLDCAKELYIFDNSCGIKDLHLSYKNSEGRWFLVFFDETKAVAQTDIYTEEPNGLIPIYKIDSGNITSIIGYIDIVWSAFSDGSSDVVKDLLSSCFNEYDNPNTVNMLQDANSICEGVNLIKANSFSVNTQTSTWELNNNIWKLTSYKSSGNALYYVIPRDNYKEIPSGHIFYICENLKADGDVRFITQTNLVNSHTSIHRGNGEYEFMSHRILINYQDGGESLLVSAARLMENVSNVEVKDFMLIDLTKTFGKGNEPTKEYMDRLIQYRMKPYYGSKALFSSDGFTIKGLSDTVADFKLLEYGNKPITKFVDAEMFKPENKMQLIVSINTALAEFVKINKTNEVCVDYVKEEDSLETIYSKVNYSLRKDILIKGMSDIAKEEAINNRANERIFRFADARPISSGDRDFYINTQIQADEPSAIVSNDGSTLYLYAHLKRYESTDGVSWSKPTFLKCDGVEMDDSTKANYLMHCNVNLINGTYYLFGCRSAIGGDLLLYTSVDGINFEYKGVALHNNHKVGSYNASNWGNTYLVLDYSNGYYYLYFEFEDSEIHWSTAVARSLNPLDGSWVNCKEDVIIKPAFQGYNPKSNRFGCGNVDFVKGMDNQPIKVDGKYYIYYHGTCYESGKHYNQSNIMRAWSYNLIDWVDEGVILDVRKKPSNATNADGSVTDGDNTSGNADHCVIEFKGKSYMFYTYDINKYPTPEYIHALVDCRRFADLLKLKP